MKNYRRITAGDDSIRDYISKSVERSSLILSLARRDIKIKYAQSVFGIAWVLIQPLTGALIFTFFFTQMFNFGSDMTIPYHLFAYSGFLCWILFTQMVNLAGTSLLSEENLIKKVYFPRIIIPLSKILGLLFDFSIGLLAFLVVAAFYDPAVLYRFLFTLPSILLILINGITIVVWLAALTIRYRDLHHIIPYLINFGIWLTPVFFPSSFFPEKFQIILELNPLSFSIDWFRAALFGQAIPTLSTVAMTVQVAIFLLFFGGMAYFIKIDRLSSDYL